MPDHAPVPLATELVWAIEAVAQTARSEARAQPDGRWLEARLDDLADDLDQLAAQARRVLGREGT